MIIPFPRCYFITRLGLFFLLAPTVGTGGVFEGFGGAHEMNSPRCRQTIYYGHPAERGQIAALGALFYEPYDGRVFFSSIAPPCDVLHSVTQKHEQSDPLPT